MSAAALLRQLADIGVQITVSGERLHVEAKPGTLTPELRAMLVGRKDDLLAALTDPRSQLLQLAETHGIAPKLVRDLSAADLHSYAGSKETLLACLRALSDDADRRAGRAPAGDTAVVLCRSCGPVWLSPAIAAVGLRLHGTPYVLGCPWCHIRKDGLPIPRPPLQCSTCASFIADTINAGGGWGSCRQGIEQSGQWPMNPQHCAGWRPRDRHKGQST
jgi:hypothetical protein